MRRRAFLLPLLARAGKVVAQVPVTGWRLTDVATIIAGGATLSMPG